MRKSPGQGSNLSHSWSNARSLNLLCWARDWTGASTETSQIINPLCHKRNSYFVVFKIVLTHDLQFWCVMWLKTGLWSGAQLPCARVKIEDPLYSMPVALWDSPSKIHCLVYCFLESALFFFFLSFCPTSSGNLQHMEVPRLEVELEL